jgi:hypothetical protein
VAISIVRQDMREAPSLLGHVRPAAIDQGAKGTCAWCILETSITTTCWLLHKDRYVLPLVGSPLSPCSPPQTLVFCSGSLCGVLPLFSKEFQTMVGRHCRAKDIVRMPP